MSNPTELPDLDRGYFKRKLTTIVRDLPSYTAQEMARELVRLAKVADENEAVKEARRAQPKGEAPQAVAYILKSKATGSRDLVWPDIAANYSAQSYDKTPLTVVAPAAQQAESGEK